MNEIIRTPMNEPRLSGSEVETTGPPLKDPSELAV